VIRHLLLVVDTEGILAEGGVGLLLALATILLFLGRGRGFKGVVIEVPYRWGKHPVVHQLVVLVGLIRGR
jgi:hypothetical protein